MTCGLESSNRDVVTCQITIPKSYINTKAEGVILCHR